MEGKGHWQTSVFTIAFLQSLNRTQLSRQETSVLYCTRIRQSRIKYKRKRGGGNAPIRILTWEGSEDLLEKLHCARKGGLFCYLFLTFLLYQIHQRDLSAIQNFKMAPVSRGRPIGQRKRGEGCNKGEMGRKGSEHIAGPRSQFLYTSCSNLMALGRRGGF